MLIRSSGLLLDKPLDIEPRYSLDIHVAGGLIRLKNPVPDSLFECSNQWPISNEPEEHLDLIARRFNGNTADSKLLCFSYKDHSLAKRLFSKFNFSSVDTLSGENSLSKISPERFVAPDKPTFPIVECGYDIILFRHFLEHSPEPLGLLDHILSLIKTGGMLYLELPIIDRFAERGVPLFLWEQHRVYFSENSALQMIQNNSMCRLLYEEIHGNDIEPSLCLMARKLSATPINRVINNSNGLGQSAETSSLFNKTKETACEYIYRWHYFVKSKREICALFGIGHAAHRFIQITETAEYFAALLDNNRSKTGLFPAGLKIPIRTPAEIDLRKILVIILGVHDRDTYKVTQTLRSKGYDGQILSIYDYPPE